MNQFQTPNDGAFWLCQRWRRPVLNYSIYLLARSGRLAREIEVACADEGTAIELAHQWIDGFDVELWQLDRIIARFTSSGTTIH